MFNIFDKLFSKSSTADLVYVRKCYMLIYKNVILFCLCVWCFSTHLTICTSTSGPFIKTQSYFACVFGVSRRFQQFLPVLPVHLSKRNPILLVFMVFLVALNNLYQYFWSIYQNAILFCLCLWCFSSHSNICTSSSVPFIKT